MGGPAITPPPGTPAPDDVTPQLGPASLGSDTPMGRFRAVLNTLSGGGIPAIQERQAADFAKRQQDAQVAFNRMRDATTYSTHARNSVGPGAPFGINVLSGKPATAEDVQGWHNDVTTGRVAAMKNLPKDAKPIAQKLFEVVHHITGHKGQDGPAGLPAPGDFGGETARPSAIPAPPQSAGAAAASGPAVPPPPGQAVPPMMQDTSLAAPENTRAMGVQNTLAQQKQAEQEKQGVEIAGIGPKTQATTAADLERIRTIMQLPEEQRLPAMMSMGVISPALMHPVEKIVPNDPNDPSKGNHYESHIPLADMMGGVRPAAPLSSGWAGTQKSGSSQYNADTGVTTTTSTQRKVLGGGTAKPSGRPATIPAPPSGGGTSSASPGGAPSGGRLSAMADDWEQNGIAPSAKDKPQVEAFMRKQGRIPPAVLTGPAQTVMMKTQPVLDQVNGLLKHIDDLKLGDNNTRGYLFLPRLNYATGGASEEGSLGKDIAGLSLGSVVEAASALQGSSRSIQALKIALDHTPNAWIDSPKLMKDKLQTIRARLQDIMDEANKYGRKNLPAGNVAARPGVLPPPPTGAPRTAEEYLKSIHVQ